MMNTVEDNYHGNETRLIFKTVLFVCGLIGFILTCSEVESFRKFNDFYLEACDFDLSKIVKNNFVQHTYKAIMIFVILARKYTWYLYIIVYFLLLCAIVLNSKMFFALWLCLSAFRSLFINIIVALTALWFGFISNCNKWTLLDFFFFKIVEIGFSTWFWCVVRTVYRMQNILAVSYDRRLLRKRRASFHGFDRHSNSTVYYSDGSSRFSNNVSLNAVSRCSSLDSIINRNEDTKRANSVEEDSDSSSFSYDLATRAEKFLQLSPETLENSSKLKSTKTIQGSYWRNTLLRIQQLPIDAVDIGLLNEKSEIEISEFDYTSESRKKHFQTDQNEFPLTLENLLGIFYKYQYYKPIITKEESEDISSDETTESEESE